MAHRVDLRAASGPGRPGTAREPNRLPDRDVVGVAGAGRARRVRPSARSAGSCRAGRSCCPTCGASRRPCWRRSRDRPGRCCAGRRRRSARSCWSRTASCRRPWRCTARPPGPNVSEPGRVAADQALVRDPQQHLLGGHVEVAVGSQREARDVLEPGRALLRRRAVEEVQLVVGLRSLGSSAMPSSPFSLPRCTGIVPMTRTSAGVRGPHLDLAGQLDVVDACRRAATASSIGFSVLSSSVTLSNDASVGSRPSRGAPQSPRAREPAAHSIAAQDVRRGTAPPPSSVPLCPSAV